MGQDLEQSCPQTRRDYPYLMSEDKAVGFAIEVDERGNITLLKWSKPVAWFLRVMSEELVRVFIKVIRGVEGENGLQKPQLGGVRR